MRRCSALESLRNRDALDRDFGYVKGRESSERRCFAKYPGGGLSGKPKFSTPFSTQDILRSRLWTTLAVGNNYEMQTAMFQPVGGMDQIGKAFAHGVSVAYQDGNGPEQLAKADWCVCTIPLSILSRIPLAVVEKMAAAIGQVPYAASVKVGLQFKRRFWEEDEAIYGGISYTDLPITLISYPSTGFQSAGKGVLLGAYVWGLEAFEFTSMTPPQRVAKALEYGTQLHLAAAFAAALLALMLPPAIGPAAAQSSDATPLYPQAAFAAASGATVYAAICQSCHMPRGHGARGGGEYPVLAGNPKLAAAGQDCGFPGGGQCRHQFQPG